MALCGNSRSVASSTSGVLCGWNAENSGGRGFGFVFFFFNTGEKTTRSDETQDILVAESKHKRSCIRLLL